MTERPLLEVKNVKKHFPITKGFLNRVVGQVKAVDGVDFFVYEGECLGLVGESGSGKTTVGRCILRAHKPTSGQIMFRPGDREIDLAVAPESEIKELREHMQMIFQDPYSSLNPRMTVFDSIGEPLLVNGMTNRSERQDRVRELLVQVGLKPHYLNRYPHAFSGGQRQRIGIARALALNPMLIVGDEPVSALDVSVQAQVLNLLMDLQDQLNLTYLFIAHDLSVVRHISDRVAVMYVGRLVELAAVEDLFNRPLHPYTEALLASVPRADAIGPRNNKSIKGEIANPAAPPPGCRFHPRCKYAQKICSIEVPQMREIEPGHFSWCHFAGELDLRPMEDQ